MKTQKIKPSRILYIVSGLVLATGIILFITILVSGVFSTTNQLNNRAIVPGTKIIELGKTGKHNIFFEYRSVIDGRVFESNNIHGLMCSLKNTETGEYIKLNNSTINSNYSISGREGKSIFTFSVDKTGTYELKAWYETGEGDEAVLAIGQGFAMSIVRTTLLSIGVLFLCFILALAIFLYTLLKRMKAKRIILEQNNTLIYRS